jgi:hypothetical protein
MTSTFVKAFKGIKPPKTSLLGMLSQGYKNTGDFAVYQVASKELYDKEEADSISMKSKMAATYAYTIPARVNLYDARKL